MLREALLQFETRQLQQLNRLLQLRRHDELLSELWNQTEFHQCPCHSSTT